MSTQELAVLPANAELVLEDKGTGIKFFNAGLMLVNFLPFPLFVDLQHLDALDPFKLVFASIFSAGFIIINAGAPQGEAIRTHDDRKGHIGFKKFAKLRLSRVPGISHLIKDEIKWTHRKDGEMLTVLEKGNISIYRMATLDPKKIWDEMYLKETGDTIDFSITHLKAIKRSLESRKATIPTEFQKRNFLTMLLGS